MKRTANGSQVDRTSQRAACIPQNASTPPLNFDPRDRARCRPETRQMKSSVRPQKEHIARRTLCLGKVSQEWFRGSRRGNVIATGCEWVARCAYDCGLAQAENGLATARMMRGPPPIVRVSWVVPSLPTSLELRQADRARSLVRLVVRRVRSCIGCIGCIGKVRREGRGRCGAVRRGARESRAYGGELLSPMYLAVLRPALAAWIPAGGGGDGTTVASVSTAKQALASVSTAR